MNILLIGNSYTSRNDLAQLLEGLCRENGKQAQVFRVTQGGRKMFQYKDPEDPMTDHLTAVLQERQYDVVILQDQSLLPILNFDAFLEGMCYVGNLVQPHTARTILYATWARKAGNIDLETNGWTPESMTQMLASAYMKAADALGAEVSSVGVSFQKVVEMAPEIDLYDSDLYHPSYLGSCLAALTHYYTIFGEYPKHTESLLLDVSVRSAFQTAVCR